MTAILDHTGKPFVLSKRQAGQSSLRARYDSATTSRDNEQHWSMADGLSAAAANSPDVRRKLRNRSRYEVANNTYACGMVRTLANDTIGTGPQLQLLTGRGELDNQVETSFWNWMQAVALPDKLRTMRMARAVDGETFGRLFVNESVAHSVPLDFKVYEAEQIARPYAQLTDPQMADGITLDSAGNAVRYTVLKQHPGDFGTLGLATETEEVAAELMVHLFRRDRPGQVRGIPEIMAALPLYAQLRRYTLAVIAAAETAANIAGLLQTQQSPQDPDEIEPLDLFDLERGQLMTLPKGWTAAQMKAEQPATTYEMFKREIINEIARCLNMPYNVAAGDSSRYNYASGRLDHKTYFKSIRVDRSYIELEGLDRILSVWWRFASMLSRTGDSQALPPAMAEFDSPPAHEWRWDGDEHVDPQKEANAAISLRDAGLLTESEYHGRRGKDWEDQQQQQARELGITVDELRRLKRDKMFQSAQQESGAPRREESDDE